MKKLSYPLYLIASLLLLPLVVLKPVFLNPKDTMSRLILILLSEIDDTE